MNCKEIRLVVATDIKKIPSSLNVELLKSQLKYVFSTVSSLEFCHQKFNTSSYNFIIIDLNFLKADIDVLLALKQKFDLQIILIANDFGLSSPYFRRGISNFVSTPKENNTISMNVFSMSITKKIEDFVKIQNSRQSKNNVFAVSSQDRIVAIASSTGGTEALEKILCALPQDICPVLIVQHMPSGFTKFFADRLDINCKCSVVEAKDGDLVCKGHVYIAPADFHMTLKTNVNKLYLNTFVGTRINGLMPAADVLFDSIALIMKKNVLGVMLTGMGNDGAKGVYKMHLNGSKIIGQNKETCVVYGMPKAAKDMGAVDLELPLCEIATHMINFSKGGQL